MFYKVHFPRKISILTRQKVEIGNKKLEHGHQTSRSLHIPCSFFQRIDVWTSHCRVMIFPLCNVFLIEIKFDKKLNKNKITWQRVKKAISFFFCCFFCFFITFSGMKQACDFWQNLHMLTYLWTTSRGILQYDVIS